MKKLYILAFVLLTSIFTSCEKDNCKNCYPTVFECKVDGKTWKTSCESKDFFGCTASDFKYYDFIPGLNLTGKNDNKNTYLTLEIRKNKLKIGNNQLYIDDFVGTYFGDKNNQEGCERYRLDTLKPYNFFLSEFDTLNQIIKGTFYFTGKDKCGKTKKITDGKFDLIYGK